MKRKMSSACVRNEDATKEEIRVHRTHERAFFVPAHRKRDAGEAVLIIRKKEKFEAENRVKILDEKNIENLNCIFDMYIFDCYRVLYRSCFPNRSDRVLNKRMNSEIWYNIH